MKPFALSFTTCAGNSGNSGGRLAPCYLERSCQPNKSRNPSPINAKTATTTKSQIGISIIGDAFVVRRSPTEAFG